jgi:hypothetical protein
MSRSWRPDTTAQQAVRDKARAAQAVLDGGCSAGAIATGHCGAAAVALLLSDVFVPALPEELVAAHLQQQQLHMLRLLRALADDVHALHEHLSALRDAIVSLEVILLLEGRQQGGLAHLRIAQHAHVSAHTTGHRQSRTQRGDDTITAMDAKIQSESNVLRSRTMVWSDLEASATSELPLSAQITAECIYPH